MSPVVTLRPSVSPTTLMNMARLWMPLSGSRPALTLRTSIALLVALLSSVLMALGSPVVSFDISLDASRVGASGAAIGLSNESKS